MPTVSDIFATKYGHSLELNSLELSDGPDAVNFVGRAARNNGVTARVKAIEGLAPALAGSITVALGGQGGAGVAFLQPFPFYCGRDVMILTPKIPMTDQEKLWWVCCLTANRFRFDFGRQANKTLATLEVPPLNEIPAWLDAGSVYQGLRDQVEVLSEATNPSSKHGPSAIGDKRVKLSDLFEVNYGLNLELNALTICEDGINFVSRSAENNGVSARVKPVDGLEPIEGGVLTVAGGGSVLETFLQSEPFYSGRDLYYLHPKVDMTVEQKLFFCMCIRENRFRYNYGRQANKTLRDILIPDISAIPSWIGEAYVGVLSGWSTRLSKPEGIPA